MGRETKQKYIYVRIIYCIIALFFLFLGYNAIHRLVTKANLPFEFSTSNNKITIHDTSLKGSVISSIDGLDLGTLFEIELYLDSKSIGDKVSLSFYANGEHVNSDFYLVPYYKDNLFILISAVVGSMFWLIALFAVNKRPDLKEARLLFWILTLFSLATVTSPGKFSSSDDLIGLIVKIVHGLSYVFGVSSFLHFAISFPKSVNRKKLMLAAIYSWAILLGTSITLSIYESISSTSILWFSRYELLWDVLQISLVLAMVLGTAYLSLKYRELKTSIERQKILWILLGNIVGVSPFLFLYVIPRLIGFRPVLDEEYLLAFLVFIPVSFSVSVIKYHIFDIDLVIKRSLLYFILTTIVLITYFGIVGVVANFSKGFIGESDKILSLVVIFMIVALFNPLRLMVNKFIDRVFFRVKYDFERDINNFSSALRDAGTMKQLCELIINQVEKLVLVKSIAIALRTVSGERLRIPAQKNFDEMTRNISALRIFQIKSDFNLPLGLPEKVEKDVLIDDIMDRVLNKWGINIVIPLIVEKDIVIGALILGDKLSGNRYTTKDIEILSVIAVQSVFAISRIQLQEKIVEEEIEREKLKELSNLKSEFVSSVSHELQTPLTSIRMFAETLSDGKAISPEKQNEYLQIIQGESERLSHLISEVLSFSKIEKGTRDYRFEKVNLNSLTKFAIYSLEYQSAKQNVKINLTPPSEDIEILGDADAISEAVLNLLSNALKYSGDSKNVDVTLLIEGEYVLIKIKDYGIGIAQDEIDDIFENYYRSRDELARYSAGTGLGLFITKEIMKAHKGEIAVKSELRNGSEFTLKFPIGLESRRK